MGYTKAQYIEKFGEEAYIIKVLGHKKQHYQEHKEEIKNKVKEYQLTHKEEKKEYNKNYGLKNRDKICQQKKEYNQSHKNERKKWYELTHKTRLINRKKYINEHKDEIREYGQNRRNTLYGRASCLRYNYIYNDKEKGFDTSSNITPEWIIDNCFSGQKCVYCGDSDWHHLGADRIDNSKPHTPDNCICACGICNEERADNFSVEEFKFYRSLHPRACDIPKEKTPLLNEKGCLIKKKPIIIK